jgi:hypothetical protein
MRISATFLTSLTVLSKHEAVLIFDFQLLLLSKRIIVNKVALRRKRKCIIDTAMQQGAEIQYNAVYTHKD